MIGSSLSRDSYRSPAIVLALSALVWSVIFVVVALTPTWKQVELKLLDMMIVESSPNKSEFPITIVGIDEVSFSKMGLQWPWPRRVHAQLIDKLAAAGAAVIVFDVLFSEPSNAEDDARLADAIKRAGNVVLAADRVVRETSTVRQWLRLDPHVLFLEAGAQTGLATVTIDRDMVVRQVPESGDALWRIVISRLMQLHPGIKPNLALPPGSLIRYAGGDHTFPYVSYHEVMEGSGSIPEGFFRDQVVIVGRDIKASPDVESAQADLFATPFLASTGWLTPGAEVHANILETTLGSTAITRLPDGAVAALVALVALASAIAMWRWRPLLSAAFGLAIAGLVAAATWGMFLKWHLWIPAASALAVIPFMYVSLGGNSYLAEQARRKEITRTFSLYVTPQVVDYLIAHPERIKLGGERRELAIMFTDLKGFTNISERLSPEGVTNLLNRYFTCMTDIVLEHEGTVCTFIGDAIMAFWGAPLDDELKAYRAVTAAVAMQHAMHNLRADFVKEGLPPIHMRIGIHCGSAIVGNLGSAKRFDYTAIGDDVNLAARLEGINKLYDTGILLSGDTARQLGTRIALRPVDKVIVKGKSQAVEVLTPCDGPELVALTEQAIRLFRNRDWAGAESTLHDLLAIAPNDRIAAIYLERIKSFRDAPPIGTWDGAVELDKL